MRLRHARTELELHDLSRRDGPTLLLLHALGGSGADWAEAPALWPGRVCALDFSGHGRSQWVHGSVYYPELLAGDADVALAETGATAIAGAGIGAYVALLLAASRRNQIAAALLLPGRGLNGSGPRPHFDRPLLGFYAPSPSAPLPTGCDPSCCTLERDIRPPEYVANFAAAAQQLLLLDDGGERPPWWSAASRTPPARSIGGDLRSALADLAGSLSLKVPPP